MLTLPSSDTFTQLSSDGNGASEIARNLKTGTTGESPSLKKSGPLLLSRDFLEMQRDHINSDVEEPKSH
jgi:hypothetical protein